jgi:hypothetical protein
MGTAVSGCPIYSRDNGACYDDYDCPATQYCSNSGYCVHPVGYAGYYGYEGGAGYAGTTDVGVDGAAGTDGASDADVGAVYCGNPNDCAAGQTCAIDGTCRPGDCSSNGCVNQFVCTQSASAPVCAPAASNACGKDGDCSSGALCVDGTCTAAADLCSDSAQCAPGDTCASGKCAPSCATDAECPAGLRCRIAETAVGICDLPAKACAVTHDCGDPALVCVDGKCLPRCNAAGACGDGGTGVCVWNGCQPKQGIVR